MLIRNFGSNVGDMGEESDRRELGLKDARRTIYVFVDQNSYTLKNFRTAKAAIVNEAVYDSDKDIIHYIKRPGSHVIRKGVYFGSITCTTPGDVQSKGSYFYISNAVNSEKNVLLGCDDVIHYGSSTYSSRLRYLSKDDMNAIDAEYEVNSIPPQFYSEYMMFKEMGDWCNLMDDEYSVKVLMSDLVDNSTTIQFMDISKYDTMRLELTGKLVDVESKFNKSILVPSSLGSAFNSYEGRGSIFIYDSDAFGLNKDGVNVRGGFVPEGKFYNKKWISENLTNALNYFSMNCKDIEEQFGHVRVMYNPDALGNKFKIRFKDYKVSPLAPLGKINNAGIVDETKSDGVTSGIDSGYVTDRAMLDAVETIEHMNNMSFMKNIQGY